MRQLPAKKVGGSSTIFSTASRGLKIASFTIIRFDGWMLMVASHTVGRDKTSKITKRFLFNFTNLIIPHQFFKFLALLGKMWLQKRSSLLMRMSSSTPSSRSLTVLRSHSEHRVVFFISGSLLWCSSTIWNKCWFSSSRLVSELLKSVARARSAESFTTVSDSATF